MRLPFLLAAAVLAQATDYTFSRIAATGANAGSGTTIGELEGGLSINNSGAVAFAAQLIDANRREAGRAVFRGTGGELTRIADTNGQFMQFWPNAINSSGTVLFLAMTKDFNLGLFTGSGGATSTVVLSTQQTPLGSTTLADLRDDGAVAFRAAGRIMMSENGRVRTVADANVPGRFEGLSLSSGAQFNQRGSLAFFGADSTRLERGGLFTDTNGTIAAIAEDSGPLGFAVDMIPSINDQGDVLFAAWPDGLPPRGGIFRASRGSIVTIREGQEFIANAGRLAINNQGAIAYTGQLPNSGLYNGPDPGKDKIIAVGDALFGSKVTSLALGAAAGRFLNDSGQIVFAYGLENREAGIAVASPVIAPPPTGARPVLPANSILDAASLAPAGIPSPGSIVSLFGSNFARELTAGSGSRLPRALAGVSVTFNGAAAPLFFVAPNQINAQVPYEIAGADAEVRVRNENGESEARRLALTVVSPSIYTLNQTGGGQGIVVLANTATLAAPVQAGRDSRPVRAGEAIAIFANGLGTVAPPIESGVNSCGGPCAPDGSNLVLRRAVTTPTVEIGGVRVPPENVLFAGLAPQFVGLYQVNAVLPPGLPGGNAVSLVLRQGTASSRADVTIAVEGESRRE